MFVPGREGVHHHIPVGVGAPRTPGGLPCTLRLAWRWRAGSHVLHRIVLVLFPSFFATALPTKAVCGTHPLWPKPVRWKRPLWRDGLRLRPDTARRSGESPLHAGGRCSAPSCFRFQCTTALVVGRLLALQRPCACRPRYRLAGGERPGARRASISRPVPPALRHDASLPLDATHRQKKLSGRPPRGCGPREGRRQGVQLSRLDLASTRCSVPRCASVPYICWFSHLYRLFMCGGDA